MNSNEIVAILEEPDEEMQPKDVSIAKESAKAKEVENPTKGTLLYIAFTLFNSFCFVFAELLY